MNAYNNKEMVGSIIAIVRVLALLIIASATQVCEAGDTLHCECGGVECSVSCDTGVATAACGNGKFDGRCTPRPESRTSATAQPNASLLGRLTVYCQMVRNVQRVSDLDFKSVSVPFRKVVTEAWKKDENGQQWNLDLYASGNTVRVTLLGFDPSRAFREIDWGPIVKLEWLGRDFPAGLSDDEFKKRGYPLKASTPICCVFFRRSVSDGHHILWSLASNGYPPSRKSSEMRSHSKQANDKPESETKDTQLPIA
jgi:hypothetical protein